MIAACFLIVPFLFWLQDRRMKQMQTEIDALKTDMAAVYGDQDPGEIM